MKKIHIAEHSLATVCGRRIGVSGERFDWFKNTLFPIAKKNVDMIYSEFLCKKCLHKYNRERMA